MKLGKFNIKVEHPRFWAMFPVLALCLLVGFLIHQMVSTTKNPASKPAPQPSVVQESLKETAYEQVRSRFAPWHLIAAKHSSRFNLIMLRENGGMEVSSGKVRAGKTWKQALSSEIEAVQPTSRDIHIRIMGNNFFTLEYGQAFMFAQNPREVYAYVKDGPKKTILVASPVKALRKA